jgi:hypothetical protein
MEKTQHKNKILAGIFGEIFFNLISKWQNIEIFQVS